MSKIQETGDRVLANVERFIVGKHQEVRLALVALLCRGHLLIEDVPGTGKTMLAKAIARSLGGSFRRIQFTPDLLPSDVPRKGAPAIISVAVRMPVPASSIRVGGSSGEADRARHEVLPP